MSNADFENEDGLSPAKRTSGSIRLEDAVYTWSERTMEALKRDVERGYRRFLEKRGMKPPEERGFKI